MSTAMGTTDSIGGQPATSICGSSGTDSRRSFSYFAVRAIWPSRTGTNVRWLDRITDGQAGMTAGLISGYRHCFSRASMLAALQAGPVIVGMNWYQGFDQPGAGGLVSISGSVRGGHEVVSRGVDMAAGLIEFDNSWGTGWGDAGRFRMSFATLDRLLAEGGDVTVPLPLSQPPPQPVPWTHPDIQFGHDQQVIDRAATAATGKLVSGTYAAQQYQAWRKARGYASWLLRSGMTG